MGIHGKPRWKIVGDTDASWGVFVIIHCARRWWWAIGAASAAGLTLLVTFAYPLLIAPIFNTLTPLE
ncbi:MAG: hypothetical protein JXA67_09640 [Micromonosporaceae bacterium]|nr:hypothetical protein [Micromonosporaceae bacterium]